MRAQFAPQTVTHPTAEARREEEKPKRQKDKKENKQTKKQ